MPSFVGRTRELHELSRLVRSGAGLVVLSGPVGIGKTALLDELVRRHPGRALRVAADERSILQRVALALGLDDADAPHALERALDARGIDILALDDVEPLGADDEALLTALSRARVLVVATRGDAVIDGARLLVGPLEEDDALALLAAHRARLGLGAADPSADLALVRRLDAVPLAIELAAAHAPLVGSGDAWPAPLPALLDALLAALPLHARHALERLARLPGPFDAAIAAAQLGASAAACVDTLRMLALRGLVLPVPVDSGVEPRFRLLGLVRDRLTSLDAPDDGAWAAPVLARAEALGLGGPRTALDVARLSLDAPFLAALVRSGSVLGALALGHHLRSAPLAARRGVLDVLARGGGALDDPRLAPLRVELAVGLGELDEARRVLAAVDEQTLGDRELAARIALVRGIALVREGGSERAEAALGLALVLAHGTRAEALVLAEAGYLAAHVGAAPELARARIERAITLASGPPADDAVRARARALEALLLSHLGEIDGGRRAATEALELARALGDTRTEKLAAAAEAMCLAELGEHDEAERAFARAIERAEATGSFRSAAEYAGFAGLCRLAAGDVRGARTRLVRATNELSRAKSARSAVLFEPFLVLSRRLLGEPSDDPPADGLASHRDPAEAAAHALACTLARAAPRGSAAIGEALDAFVRAEPLARALRRQGAELRLTLAIGRALAGASAIRSARLVVERSARRCTLDDTSIELGKQPILFRLLVELAERARSAPGVATPIDALLAAGWPGQRTIGTSGSQRVHTAVRRLRQSGLEPVLKSNRDGYWIEAAVTLD